jgi:hypothetical protein
MQDGNMSYRFGSRESVDTNRAQFLARTGMSGYQIAMMDATHGTDIHVVHRTLSKELSIHTADALMTQDCGVTLFLLTADCLPTIFFDTRSHALALVHLGWKPISLGLVQKVLTQMMALYGTNPQDLKVVIGPSITKASYVHTEIKQTSADWEPYCTRDTDGNTHVDLAGYVAAVLIEAGVEQSSLEISTIDTAQDARYFSHYRALRTGEVEGRLGTVCVMMP